jgi:hypothetical protein
MKQVEIRTGCWRDTFCRNICFEAEKVRTYRHFAGPARIMYMTVAEAIHPIRRTVKKTIFDSMASLESGLDSAR